MIAVGPSSRMARRRPSKAPAATAASRSVGSAASARASRMRGQAAGVLSRSVMTSGLGRGARTPALGGATQRGVEGREVGRLGRAVGIDRRDLVGGGRGLQAQVGV